jgi:hypothetical protein
LYSSSNIIRAIKLKRMVWAGHVASMGKIINAYKISSKCMKEIDKLENQCIIDGRITVIGILNSEGVPIWARFVWLIIRSSGRSCELKNEPSGSISVENCVTSRANVSL